MILSTWSAIFLIYRMLMKKTDCECKRFSQSYYSQHGGTTKFCLLYEELLANVGVSFQLGMLPLKTHLRKWLLNMFSFA